MRKKIIVTKEAVKEIQEEAKILNDKQNYLITEDKISRDLENNIKSLKENENQEFSKKAILDIALECGFSKKLQSNGELDLNSYVYDFAYKLLQMEYAKKGYKLVPLEPTQRMGEYGVHVGAKSTFAADMIYRAMISGSPIIKD